MNTETLLIGCKINQPDYMEEILYQCKGYVNKEKVMAKGKEWALKNNYNRLRITEINLAVPPNFIKSIN